MRFTKTFAALVICATSIGSGGAIAGAHSVNVDPPGGGQATCQFMGGPGNPNHVGHANGHLVALDAERSGAVQIGGC